MEAQNLIVDKSLEFSLHLIKFCQTLDEHRKFIVSNQLLRSGTSIGANVFEGQCAESRNDFIHKMKIASKEAQETLYWLRICELSEDYPYDETLRNEINLIMKILSKIIYSSKQNK